MRYKKVLSVLLFSVIFLFIIFFVFRNSILNWQIRKTAEQINQRSGALLEIKSASFSGLLTVSIHDINLLPANGDTLLHADTLSVSLSFWTLLRATIRLKELYASGLVITMSCRDSVCNYEGFLRHDQEAGKATETAAGPSTGKNYSRILKQMLDRVFNLAPQKAAIKNSFFIYRKDGLERRLLVKDFHSDEDSVDGTMEDQTGNSSWKCSGKFSQDLHTLLVNVYPDNGNKPFVPLLNDIAGLALSFDTLNVSLDGYKWSGNTLKAGGAFRVKQLIAFHKKISDDTIKVSSAAIHFSFNSGKSYLEIDSTSSASIGGIRFNPYVRYSNDEAKEYSIKIETDKTAATEFFSSLPEGMFDEVRGIEADGTLQYSLNFNLNASQPDSAVFESSLKKEKFRLNKSGSVNLMKMTWEFSYPVYEHDRFIRSFPVGPSNPYYNPLECISPLFINAVLTSEDGNFFFHNGFNEESFRKSIITNFKKGKFVRGGSTISMQLVKNVFLTRKKTIARKAEEALLVWLIESNRLYNKERMLEVYLNIIELGPNIYGIGEAAPFYFNKSPDNITLPEGIFLASLLPHPKWFKYSFDTLGNLKPYLSDYYRIVSDHMLRKNLISQGEHDSLQPHVVLSGPAREMVIPTDSLPEEEEDDDFLP